MSMLHFPALPSHALRPVLICAAAAAALAPAPVAAQGDLLIAPTRLVLDGRRGGEVILSNIGNQEATYRVTLELRRMTPEGELQPVDEAQANAAEKAAMEMVRYAPRRVTLPPNEPQAIRISARPGPELADGEYRVHMSFTAIPKAQPVEPVTAPTQTSGFAINLVPLYGITMPIIIRKGELQVTTALANARIVASPGGQDFAVDIARTGTESTYGDLLVYKRGSNEPVFIARGIGVYPEIAARHLSLTIPAEQAAAMRGPVRVEFRQPVENGGAMIASLEAAL
jgi:hypothetical protein